MRPLLFTLGALLLVLIFVIAFGNVMVMTPFLILTTQLTGALTFPIMLMALLGFLAGAAFTAALFLGKKDDGSESEF